MIYLIILLIIYQILWVSLIKDFKLKNCYYIISLLISLIVICFNVYIYNYLSISLFAYSLILLILVNLSLIDCKYYEISQNTYWFLLFPIVCIIMLSLDNFFNHMMSAILMFLLFFVIDKIIGIEYIGGADVKVLILLSLTIDYSNSLMLLILTLMFSIVMFLVIYIINKIRKKNSIKIPMIVGITLSWIIICFMNVK